MTLQALNWRTQNNRTDSDHQVALADREYIEEGTYRISQSDKL
jgi:hypothetical protein